MPTNDPPWFQYRGHCSLCGWDGPLEGLSTIRKTFTCEYYVCPSCGQNRTLETVPWSKRREPRACISERAVHQACGFWHKPGTPCLGRKLTRAEWLAQI